MPTYQGPGGARLVVNSEQAAGYAAQAQRDQAKKTDRKAHTLDAVIGKRTDHRGRVEYLALWVAPYGVDDAT